MKSICYYFCLISLFFGSASMADDKADMASLMHTFLFELTRISPYLASQSAFTSPKGQEDVRLALNALNKKILKEPKPIKDQPGFRLTYLMLADHLRQSEKFFEIHENEYTRMRLNSLTNFCVACHTQIPVSSRRGPFASFESEMAKISFSSANLMFITRRFDEALKAFDKLAREYPKSPVSADELVEVYRKKLAIFARIKRDPQMGIADLTEDLKNQNLPKDIRQNLKDWIEALNKWQSSKDQPDRLSTEDLVKYVSKNIPPLLDRKIAPSDPNLLLLLRLSGLLYERLYQEPNGAHTQELLYYLAVCERSLAPVYWYSVSEVYLKECVVKFPKQAYSKKCFDAYKENMEERFSGRPIPEFIQSSIDALSGYL